MKVYKLERRKYCVKDFLGRPAEDRDCTTQYSEPGVYEVDGTPAIIYGKLPESHDEVLRVLSNLRWTTGTFGKKTIVGLETKTFGFCTRRVTRDFCHPSTMSLKYPDQHQILCDLGTELNAIYARLAPEVAQRHSEQLKGVNAGWVIPNSRFTSGIVNNSNALPYHFDRGNFDGVFSSMAVFRKLCLGGNLSVPELNANFLIEDRSFFLFDGQSLLHGVTPIKRLNKNSYRYSLVYYSRKGMLECGTAEEEVNRIRRLKVGRERSRRLEP